MDKENAKKVIFIITTDGLENASREYTRDKIKEMIEAHNTWEFMYIGADIDSYAEGSSIGISKKNISSYKKDRKGVSKLFNSLGKVSCAFFEEDKINEDWKDELEDYIKSESE